MEMLACAKCGFTTEGGDGLATCEGCNALFFADDHACGFAHGETPSYCVPCAARLAAEAPVTEIGPRCHVCSDDGAENSLTHCETCCRTVCFGCASTGGDVDSGHFSTCGPCQAESDRRWKERLDAMLEEPKSRPRVFWADLDAECPF